MDASTRLCLAKASSRCGTGRFPGGLFEMDFEPVVFLVALLTQNWGPFLLLLGAGLFAGLGISVAWFRFARNLIPAGVLLSIPGYVTEKLNIYKRFVTNRQKEWVRTQRDGE